MKGFKVVAEDKTHHEFVYKEGLNVDTNPFQPEGTCVEGGLYFFTDIKDVLNWIDYGVYLYEVKVPEGHQYVQDPARDKYRASALILSSPKDLRKIETWDLTTIDTELLFCKSIYMGMAEIFEELLPLITISEYHRWLAKFHGRHDFSARIGLPLVDIKCPRYGVLMHGF